ncbi:MAG: tyrosine-type recombinase/integrase, partial [Dermatophilaceae bacterium]
MTALAPTLQSFFTDYLIGQRGVSGHTITAYRDTLRLLLGYAHERTGVRPSNLDIAMLDTELVADFLTMLEQRRANSTTTRNARLAAIHSLFRHAAWRHPEHADLIARVLAIPAKRAHNNVVSYLTGTEVDALLASPDLRTWTGRRDHTLLLLMVTTGVRVGELTALTRGDVCTDRHGAHIAIHGKGRKDRLTPLDTLTTAALRGWLTENSAGSHTPLFPARGTTRKMTTDAVAQRIKIHTATATASCPSIAVKNVTPHVMRHSCAMGMRAVGLDVTTISLWLGHESPTSSRPYLHADLQLKRVRLFWSDYAASGMASLA